MLDISLVGLQSMMPFFLVLAVIYGSLEVAGVFKNRAVNIIIALVVGFFAIMNAEIVAFLELIIPYAAILFVVLFLIMFIKKSIGGIGGGGGTRDWTLIIVIIGLILLFLASQGMDLISNLNLPISAENIILIVAIVLIVAVFYAAYKSPEGS